MIMNQAGKGDARRPQYVSDDEMTERWNLAFGGVEEKPDKDASTTKKGIEAGKALEFTHSESAANCST